MARKPRIEVAGGLYHVITRGNDRQTIFHDAKDFLKFLALLTKEKDRSPFYLYAYCLMSNHVHLLLERQADTVGSIMHRVLTGYSQYYNRRHRHVGHVFQGRHKAILCQSDPYLAQLVRYIHLNPVQAKMVRKPEQYLYSSHRAYLGLDPAAETGVAENGIDGVGENRVRPAISAIRKRHESQIAGPTPLPTPAIVQFVKSTNRKSQARPLGESKIAGTTPDIGIVDVDPVLRRFGAKKDRARKYFADFVNSGIGLVDEQPPYEETFSGIVGSEEFVDEMIHRMGVLESGVIESGVRPAIVQFAKDTNHKSSGPTPLPTPAILGSQNPPVLKPSAIRKRHESQYRRHDPEARADRKSTGRTPEQESFDSGALIAAIEEVFAISRQEIRDGGKNARCVRTKEVLILAGRALRASVTQLAEITGLNISTISRRCDSARSKAANDPELLADVDRVAKAYRRMAVCS